jgi:hypothetical protein
MPSNEVRRAMTRRRSVSALLSPPLLLLLLALAGPVLAKEGMQARLDAPIPIDAPPGTTLEVGWTTTVPDGAGGAAAFSGAPVFIALTEPGAAEPRALVFGDESPAGSGHFTASIVVPKGGIAPDGVMIGLRSETCENGVCERTWMPFQLLGPVLTTLPVVPAAVPVASAAADPAATPAPARAPAADAAPWLGLAAVGGLLALAAAALGVRAGRRGAATTVIGAIAALVLVAAAAGSALAKEEGVIVSFDPPIPDDAVAGSTLDLTWSMLVEPTDGSAPTTPYQATPLIVRVTSRTGVPTDLTASHLGGGRYAVSLTVPDAGLGAIDLGLPQEDGSMLLLAEVFDAPPLIQTIGPGATADDAVPTIDPSLLVLGLAAASAGALAAIVVTRRRHGAMPAVGD